MSATVAQKLDAVPRRNLGMRGESVRARGEALCKDLADKQLAGQVIERALAVAGLERKEIAEEIGYSDLGTTISKWITGVEPVQFARVINHPEFRLGLAVALAEACGDSCLVQTVITVNRKRASR